jgi:predicted O-methyltransferase YrrM
MQGYASDIKKMRPMFEAAKQHLKDKPVIGVEVGVSAGVNACEVIDGWQEITKLFGIDSYPVYSDFKQPEAQQTMLYCAINSFINQPRIYLIIESSAVACNRFESESVDFVYIDANHSYNFVKEDILAWLPKVKKGGVIGGHDLDWQDTEDHNEYSVLRAVKEIFGDKMQHDKKLFTPDAQTIENGRYTGKDSDWWVFL